MASPRPPLPTPCLAIRRGLLLLVGPCVLGRVTCAGQATWAALEGLCALYAIGPLSRYRLPVVSMDIMRQWLQTRKSREEHSLREALATHIRTPLWSQDL
ncbi:hypothetical protein SNOG_03948 [Parastagonospora nodorum SN15]|uniref:Uncharacterized protein n=1 Tax=Phaeosphaeria nodorum (strain SN15 / ATCC MYA-4574 / FGSC 10173) TaxID=321614 RepID=Q0UWB6_PHANO|nr:hypothetical protein SNOG_03948 [Parastagonospora nodorum SN15]EAT89153.1 hypothetical protein SNOG_03948 [Parastagonospora nodorum SN15]